MTKQNDLPSTDFVSHLPNLIPPEEYGAHDRKKIRVRIRATEEGLEILGDSMYPALLEKLLADAGARRIQSVLCG